MPRARRGYRHTRFQCGGYKTYSNKSIEAGGQLVGMSNMSMSVWAEKIDSEDIKILGGYKNKGDRVMVTGVFNRACHEHGGDTDIHAFSVEVIRPTVIRASKRVAS